MKLISINIEGSMHLERVLPFIATESPDIFCLQEVYEKDLSLFAELGYTTHFLPLTQRMNHSTLDTEGIALCSREMPVHVASHIYNGDATVIPTFDSARIIDTFNNGVLHGEFSHNGDTFIIATTHFTWNPHGNIASPEQTKSLERLLAYTATLPSHIICGDFNIPRNHNPLYDELVKKYADTIPTTYTSSLDKTLHRHGADADKDILFSSFMVDYIFTQPSYRASDVRLVFGTSDHAGVVGTVTKE